MQWVLIKNQTQPDNKAVRAKHCRSFFCRLRGLMMKKCIAPYEGLLLVDNVETRINAAVHMLFMRIDLAIIWVNSQNIVVDVKHARRWRLSYMPKSPASYILETHPDRVSDFQIGDTVSIDEI